jgi:hypothetical protein
MATRANRGVLVGAMLAVTATMAMAHEHHEDEIPDGSAVSAEPLVSSYDCARWWALRRVAEGIGLC